MEISIESHRIENPFLWRVEILQPVYHAFLSKDVCVLRESEREIHPSYKAKHVKTMRAEFHGIQSEVVRKDPSGRHAALPTGLSSFHLGGYHRIPICKGVILVLV